MLQIDVYTDILNKELVNKDEFAVVPISLLREKWSKESHAIAGSSVSEMKFIFKEYYKCMVLENFELRIH